MGNSRLTSRRRKFDHGEPIRRPDSLPILLFLFALIAGLLLLNPRATHALVIDLPHPYPPGTIGVLTPSYDRISLTADGSVMWNGTSVTDNLLKDLLSQRSQRPTVNTLLLDPDRSTRYVRVLQVLGFIAPAGKFDGCFRFAGNARFARYDDPATFDNLVLAEPIECLPPYG